MKIFIRKIDFDNKNDEVIDVIEGDALSEFEAFDYAYDNKYKLCQGSATFFRKNRNNVIYFEYKLSNDAVPEDRSLYLDYMKVKG